MENNNNLSIQSSEGTVKKWIVAISIAVPVVVAVLLFMPAKLDLASECGRDSRETWGEKRDDDVYVGLDV